jgi:hypothetical protein
VGNKEESEPSNMIELSNVCNKPVGAFYERLENRFHLITLEDQETECSIWRCFKTLFKTHDVRFVKIFQIQMIGEKNVY